MLAEEFTKHWRDGFHRQTQVREQSTPEINSHRTSDKSQSHKIDYGTIERA